MKDRVKERCQCQIFFKEVKVSAVSYPLVSHQHCRHNQSVTILKVLII